MKLIIKTHYYPAIITCPICGKGDFSTWEMKYLKGDNHSVCRYCNSKIEIHEEKEEPNDRGT